LRLLLLLAGATATALFLPLAAGVAGSSRGCTVGASDGRGASQVWILRPAGPPKSVVVYAHGWTATSPRDWHLAQMDHLCAEGSIVIFPQYQAGSFSDTFEKYVVGTPDPRALWRRLAGQSSSRKQYQLIRSTPGFLAYHEAPKDMTAVATRIFWAPIDALVADARRGR